MKTRFDKLFPKVCRTYRLIEEIGSGGSGAVYLTWHKRLRKYVVLKAAKINSAEVQEVFRNEVEALKNIKNTHVPQVLDILFENDYCFTVIEYIKGESFDKLLKKGRIFTEDQITTWYSQLASALDAIHKHDVYHRDIKPANIMLTSYGDICLIDFNSALVNGNNTGVISRSMGYASPEQYEFFKMCRSHITDTVKGNSDHCETVLFENDCGTDLLPGEQSAYNSGTFGIDWKLSDIYSLGATMYHLLTGKRPPVRADEVAQIPRLSEHPERLLRIIERSMRTNPSQRFVSAKELGYAIGTI